VEPLNHLNVTITDKPTASIRRKSFSFFLKLEFISFLDFLKKPRRYAHTISTKHERVRRFLIFLGLTIGFDLVYLGTIGLAINKFVAADYLPNYSLIFFIMVGVIIAPLIEEIIFRAGLRTPTYTLFFGPIFICLITGNWQFALTFSVIACVFGLLWKYLNTLQNKKKNLSTSIFRARQFIENYPKIFYFYVISFALIHIGNFGINDISGFLIFFAVIPQFVGGLCMSYIRLRDGLGYAIALHSTHNLIVHSIGYLLELIAT
jgi:membrane protease YdiL (CAAX protease family)